MPDFDLTPAQSGMLDQLDAEPLSVSEAGVLAKKADGNLVQLTVEGEVVEVTEPVPPEPETVDGTAVEVPAGDPSEATPEEIEAAKPTAIDLVVDPNDPNDVYRVMDRADEVLILEELQNRALDTFVYSFESGGKRQTDLTVAGVNETVRLMNERGHTQIGISDQPPVVDHEKRGGEEYVRVMVFARDARQPGSGKWGTAVEPVNFQDSKRKGQWDKFSFTKALNKAQRNALKMQIPEDWRQTIIAQYLGTHHMQQLKALDPTRGLGVGAIAELPPALDDDRAKAIKKEIHEAYAELRKLNPLRMPPGRMNGFLTKAETESHERMELFRDQLRDLAAQEAEEAAKRAERAS